MPTMFLVVWSAVNYNPIVGRGVALLDWWYSQAFPQPGGPCCYTQFYLPATRLNAHCTGEQVCSVVGLLTDRTLDNRNIVIVRLLFPRLSSPRILASHQSTGGTDGTFETVKQ